MWSCEAAAHLGLTAFVGNAGRIHDRGIEAHCYYFIVVSDLFRYASATNPEFDQIDLFLLAIGNTTANAVRAFAVSATVLHSIDIVSKMLRPCI